MERINFKEIILKTLEFCFSNKLGLESLILTINNLSFKFATNKSFIVISFIQLLTKDLLTVISFS